MYEIGSVVVYGGEGVCRISDVIEKSFHDKSGIKRYYVLIPIENQTFKVFVPCDSDMLLAKMQKLLSYKEIKSLIDSDENETEWIEDNKQRNRCFKEILNSYDRGRIIGLAKLLYKTKMGKNANAKKLYASDEETFKKLKKILYAEFSTVMEISEEEIIPFLFGEIECKEK